MPIYEYKCESCCLSFEIMQKVDERPPICANIVVSGSVERICGGKCKKLVSKSSFALKGGGWYKDGYIKKNKD
jgi:putative FmdB family regulatory protein